MKHASILPADEASRKNPYFWFGDPFICMYFGLRILAKALGGADHPHFESLSGMGTLGRRQSAPFGAFDEGSASMDPREIS